MRALSCDAGSVTGGATACAVVGGSGSDVDSGSEITVARASGTPLSALSGSCAVIVDVRRSGLSNAGGAGFTRFDGSFGMLSP